MDKKNVKDFRRGTVAFPPTKVFIEPTHDEDEFEDNNQAEEAHLDLRIIETKQASNNSNLLDLLKPDEDEEGFNDMLAKVFPPNPLLPKTFQNYDESPRFGGQYAFLKLQKFKGRDMGKQKLREDSEEFTMHEFSDSTTLKDIFHIDETHENELVFCRHQLDFSAKTSFPGKRDEVLEENLLDVKKLLKQSTASDVKPGCSSHKALVNMKGVEPFYKKKEIGDRTLMFESRFESGNLAAAVKLNDSEYHLLLQNDVNTGGHTQWFFFMVQNTQKFSKVRFNMLNLSKPDSLYNEGMKILIYSEKTAVEKDIGWTRGGFNIGYYQNGIRKEGQKRYKSYYTHTFTYEFDNDNDTVFFAYSYPYTFTDLLGDLNKVSNDPIKSQFVTRKTLCDTLAGNKCEVLTITSRQNLENLPKRKGVVLSARVHPGESVGSWMMKGALDFLTDDQSEEAELLRQNFVFKVIPMLNPDGVINGNYRCSLAGCDLNRRWKAPSRVLHPTVFNTKKLIEQFSKERDLVCFCDFHGHSRRKNIFMYGCNNPNYPEDTRIFPFILSKLCPFFSFNYSRFGNQKSKEATARMAIFNEIKIPSIYTCEASFCGNDSGPYQGYHFSTDNLMQTGRDFCRSLLVYSEMKAPILMVSNIETEIKGLQEYFNDQNLFKDPISRDPDVQAMQIFTDKIKETTLKGKAISFKVLKRALLQVLRHIHDIQTEGTGESSSGSEVAPSDDNLDPEAIDSVVPIEDQSMINKLKKKKQDKQMLDQLGVSPVKRKKQTLNEIAAQKRNSQLLKPNRRFSMVTKPSGLPSTQQKTDPAVKPPIGSNLKTLEKEQIVEEQEDDDHEEKKEEVKVEEYIQQEEDKNVGTETGPQNKKKKRNVETKDAWTQTDRSDYMLIKYRQKQREQKNSRLIFSNNPDNTSFSRTIQRTLKPSSQSLGAYPSKKQNKVQSQTFDCFDSRSPGQGLAIKGSSQKYPLHNTYADSNLTNFDKGRVSRNTTQSAHGMRPNRSNLVSGYNGAKKVQQFVANTTSTIYSNNQNRPAEQVDAQNKSYSEVYQDPRVKTAMNNQRQKLGAIVYQQDQVSNQSVSPIQGPLTNNTLQSAKPSHNSSYRWESKFTDGSNGLPPKPQQKKISNGTVSIDAIYNKTDESLYPPASLNDVKVLENIFIQQKLQATPQVDKSRYPLVHQNIHSLNKSEDQVMKQSRTKQRGDFQNQQHFNNSVFKKILESSWRVHQHQMLPEKPKTSQVQSRSMNYADSRKKKPSYADSQSYSHQDHNQVPPSAGMPGHKPVKISIVNVTNQFNIQNNIYINPPPAQQMRAKPMKKAPPRK